MNVSAEGEGITYALLADGTYEVTGGVAEDGVIVIADNVDGVPVTRIANRAFAYDQDITSVVLPDTIERIGYDAFYACKNLAEIVIPESVTYIGGCAFAWCDDLTIVCKAEEQPAGWDAKWNLSAYETVWGACAEHDFADWTVYEATCTEDGYQERACNVCDYVDVEVLAATGHNHVSNVVDPTELEEGYTEYVCDCGDSYKENFVIATGVTAGLEYNLLADGTYEIASKGESDATEIVIPATKDGIAVTKIANRAFAYEDAITSIVLPETIEKIGYDAFYACKGLTSIVIPASVSYVGGCAFAWCDNLVIACKADAQPAGWDANWNLSGVTVTWGACAEHDFADWVVENATCLEDGQKSRTCTVCGYAEIEVIEATGHNHVANVVAPTEFEEGYTEHVCACGDSYIDSYVTANAYTDGLSFELIANGTYAVIGIGDCAQTEIAIPATYQGIAVTKIATRAFAYNNDITSVVLPASIVEISYEAFYACKSLATITIPVSVEVVRDHAFAWSTSLTINCDATAQPAGWSEKWNSTECEVVWAEEVIEDDGTIKTAAKLVEALSSGANEEYVLSSDIVLTDAVLDPNGAIATGSYTFNANFFGVLDGQGHTIVFNVNTDGVSYFNGIFNKIEGTIKNANIVINVSSPYSSAHGVGIFATHLNGSVENCIITYTNKLASGYGYASLFAHLGANAEIKNTIINAQNVYAAGSLIAEYAAATAKITNVGLVSNQLHYPDLAFGQILPTEKCIIDGLYVYNNIANVVAGKADYVLDADKYAAVESTQFSYSTEAQILEIYNKGANYSAYEIIGSAVVAASIEIIKKDGATTINSFALVSVSLELDQTALELKENSSAVQINATATYNGEAASASAISWSSSNDAVVTVANGLVTVVGCGEATVYATFYGMSVACEVVVNEYWEEIDNGDALATTILANPNAKILLTDNVTITSTVLGGTIACGGKMFSSFAGILDANGNNITFNVEADGYFSGLFTNFTGTIKNANIILWGKFPGPGNHNNGVLTNTFDGVIDSCTINFTNTNGGGAHGYAYYSLLGTMGENAVLKNTIINAKEAYLEGGIIAEHAAATAQITNVAVVSNQLHYPKCWLGKVLPIDRVVIDGLYVTDTIDDLLAGKADFELDYAKYEGWTESSYQFAYGSGYDADAMYTANTSVTIASILGREVVKVDAPIITSSGASSMVALGVSLNPAYLEITMNDSIIEITQGDEPVALSASATYKGEALDVQFTWTSSNPAVVSVENGIIVGVGEGEAYVYASYLGVMSEGCLVKVEGLWYEITDEASFVEAIATNLSYRLTQDLVLTDKFIDTTSTYGGSNITSDFYGTLDGQGHTVTFNIDTTGQSYFNGAFRFIYGAVKNTNFVVNMKSPVNNSGTARGVLAYRVYGTVEGCIVNVQVTKTAGDYGYWSVFGELGENAVINNVVVKAVSSYMAGGAIAKVVQPTSKVSNFVLISNNLGWADMTLGSVLPSSSKCDITNLYVYDNIVPSGYNLKLDEAKYQAEGAPNNITWTTSNCADSNIDVLYSRPANVAIADIVGFDVEAYDAEIITKDGVATLASLRFVK